MRWESEARVGDSFLRFLEEMTREWKPEGWIRVCHIAGEAEGRGKRVGGKTEVILG